MKIGIIASYFDDLYIMSLLNNYDFDYKIYLDWNNWPYQDKWFEKSFEDVQKWIEFLKKQWVKKIIVPPIYEMHMQNDKNIIPLFTNYLLECLQHSLVGKIGFVWDFADSEKINEIFPKICQNYTLTTAQQNTKKFRFPFDIWFKQNNLWKFFLYNLSFRQPLVNKVIKNDLRYFKDAFVDTVIPLNWWYFAFQRSIKNFFNLKKIKFHWTDKLHKTIDETFQDYEKEKYFVQIFSNWKIELLTTAKKRKWIINKGKQIQFENIKI